MNTIVLADNIGKWLVASSKNYNKWMYRIISGSQFECYHNEDSTREPFRMNFGLSYNNEKGYYILISNEEAQAILNSRVKPHPNQKVINKIREMKARRKEMGYEY